MIMTLQKITEVLFFPISFSCLVGFFFCFYKTKQSLLHICLYTILSFMIIWRGFYGIISERYCCIFLIPCIIIGVFALSKLHQLLHRYHFYPNLIISVLFFLCIGTQIAKVFHPFPKAFLLDLGKEIEERQINDHGCAWFIYDSEYRRLGGSKYPFVYPLSKEQQGEENLSDIFEQYRYWGKAVYFILPEDTDSPFLTEQKLVLPQGTSLKMEIFYFSNREKSKRLTLYQYLPVSLPLVENITETSGEKENLIENGNMEIMMSSDILRKRLKRWIDDGAVFYDSNSIMLPEYQILLPTWNTLKEYPEVFADSNCPIEGNYSLHIRFKGLGAIYLMQKIPACPGVLTFKIKNSEKSSALRLFRYDYASDGKMQYPKQVYNFYISDNQSRIVYLNLKDSDYLGEETLFVLEGNDCDFLLDDVSFFKFNREI
ncbi:hypothetical protein [Victivallis sp. Marseille-Q1083]|uniref:hypothetical protein n=1 Tax=Victivallis sp. Marseille-Q1083 TaxID=2717288 RepID=UPI00158A5DD0|nr:hypothetical protein [Victivallis sp. Marseille-Q1083]